MDRSDAVHDGRGRSLNFELALTQTATIDRHIRARAGGLVYIRVAHGSLFSSIFASFFVPFFARFGRRFHHLAGKNGMKITIKNDEKRLL